jgi:CubicO group peptidase (beta-lactamase class C family)
MIGRRAVLTLAGALAVAPKAVSHQATAASPTFAAAPPAPVVRNPLDHVPEMLRAEFPATLALRVERGGETLLDYRRDGVSPDALFRIYSVTKSVLATLVGIALDGGALPSLDRTAASYFPEVDLSAADPRARDVTIRHLLTMTARWDTLGQMGLARPPDMTVDAFLRPMAGDPGTAFRYDNASSNLLGLLVARAVGEPLDVFAERALLRPLGIERFTWRKTPDGYAAGSGGLSLPIAALMRFGSCAAQRGRWNGQRLVSERYMDEMLGRRTPVDPREGIDYGYLWFLQKTPNGRHESIIAQGFGGQVLQVVPDLGLIVATTTEPGDRASTRFIRSAVLPALGL